jgi:hypothetical protein
MLALLSRHKQAIAWFLVSIFYVQILLTPMSVSARSAFTYVNVKGREAALANIGFASKQSDRKTFLFSEKKNIQQSRNINDKEFVAENGPDQPEMQAFSSVNNTNMVDLFSGDFSYNIPLMDVGGYPINLSYRSGISMDQEASWVGLGWAVNPGTISRNLRGLPDDFDGRNDSITKVMNIKPNQTVGVTAGASAEMAGLPIVNIGASMGIFHNTYKGWGIEKGLNASINSGRGAFGILSGGLSLTDNSQEGFSISPSIAIYTAQQDQEGKNGTEGSFSLSLPYNSRSGLNGLQLSAGLRQYHTQEDNAKKTNYSGSSFNSIISFASPGFTPSITIPYTSRQFSFTAKTGTLQKIFDANFFISGYMSTQFIAKEDTVFALPAYGYLNYQQANGNRNALLDFNLEKDIPYHEKPPVPHIAIPSYTYDAFSITGEGTGGMFRAYRGDMGFVHDHAMRTRDESDRASIDFGGGDIVHSGVDLNVNRAYTQNGPWLENNMMRKLLEFKKDSALFEASYFRNPGEKSVNSKRFYDYIGGDDVVAVSLFQPSKSSSFIQATNYLTRYRNRRAVGRQLIQPDSAFKTQRDKRTQVISYLTAKEAETAGLSKYIESYNIDTFALEPCASDPTIDEGIGTGLIGNFYRGDDFTGEFIETRTTENLNYENNFHLFEADGTTKLDHNFCARWLGRIKAPSTGTYNFETRSDDGVRLWINDSLIVDNWKEQSVYSTYVDVNLIEGEFYTIRIDYFQKEGEQQLEFRWFQPGQSGTRPIIEKSYLYPPAPESFAVGNIMVKENRVNRFRKSNHISEVSVLNNDGRRYVYGLPVYNLKQKEVTFAVDPGKAKKETGLVQYSDKDNSTGNENGIDHFYKREEIPAYAHSYLLTGILSPDYIDVTGNGISDDDKGDAIKFNYSKVAGIDNPFRWKTPYVKDSANYNEGLKTDRRDDKGSMVYGEKEMWYLHSIESKTMVAFFVTENRSDLLNMNERGVKENLGQAKQLKEINLYSKADFSKKGLQATPIKTVHFKYDYELAPSLNEDAGMGVEAANAKLTLKKVWFTYNDNNKGALNPYIFNYSNNPAYQQKAYDRWGNYKTALQNPGSTTGNVIENDEFPYAIQDSAVAAANASAWALDSILLPSGGAIKVDYESDDYAYVQDKRTMNMMHISGFGSAAGLTAGNKYLYDGSQDNNYVYVNLPEPVNNSTTFYKKYLQGINKLYFRLFVKMPGDQYGSGSEYVSGYAEIDPLNGYGITNSTLGWIKLAGVSLKGDGDGPYSPMVKTALQFLRLNLPSKAYKNSEPGDDIKAAQAVQMLVSSFGDIFTAFTSFDKQARDKSWANEVDLSRSFIRLDNPIYKKYGGGHRVKRIKIYDNWNKMTQRRSAIYGQEYSYTTEKEINGVIKTISSGVASYEPGIGGDENPFRQPIEYVEKAAILGPVTLGYSEEPLGESFFPSASVGYSKVRVRTINHTNNRSANGIEETQFYTTYDFPTYTDMSNLDQDTKKRFAPGLSNFLRINARHHIALSQGFKVELNDMNGKLRAQASYAETDLTRPFKYTYNIYKTENPLAEHKRLANDVMTIGPDGTIDPNAVIGKDVELLTAMREQQSVNNGYNVNINADVFSIPFIPGFFVLPSLLNLYQREENLYRSVATVKVIQRFGILDSVVHFDKGSKVTTKDLLYDSETGDVLLSRTENEFNDPVYTFTYPSHWAYDNMGLAYKNIDVVFRHVTVKGGKIIAGVTNPENFFNSGDEIYVGGKKQLSAGAIACDVDFASFDSYEKLWAVNRNVISGGTSQIYFVDREGKPYNGDDVTLKIIRSGRRNILSAVGSVTMLTNPINFVNGNYHLGINTSNKVVAAQAAEFKQIWKVDDKKQAKLGTTLSCHPKYEVCEDCICECLKNLFNYLRDNNKLFVPQSQKIRMDSLIAAAAADNNSISDCPIFGINSSNEYYYALTTNTSGTLHRLHVGQATVSLSLYSAGNFTDYPPLDFCDDDSAHLYYSDGAKRTRVGTFYIEGYRDSICELVPTITCESVISDTAVNPYVAGIVGNWRLNKNYTYFGPRAETDPSSTTNIRTDGSFADFSSFWAFFNGQLEPQYDTTRWMWNSEITLFNRKGFEIENKDPLGRYNSGLYGYNSTMPVAVIQNSRFREAGFDGFEDYRYATQACDTGCQVGKMLDFTGFKGNIDTLRSHTGKASLRLANESATVTFDLSTIAQDTEQGSVTFTNKTLCSTSVLDNIKMDNKNILPSFSPLKGTRMLISAWVREDQDCKCTSYVNNNITINLGGSPFTFQPSGNIIEGWQRYEGVFDIPSNATTITIGLRSTSSVPVNFDDVRILPFNGNMKSFVFHPVNLRLMAELDENNYATFYEYDDDGTLIRVKKETERGIKTIKETRSALIKE